MLLGATALAAAFYWAALVPIVATINLDRKLETKKDEAFCGKVITTNIDYPHMRIKTTSGENKDVGLPASTLTHSQRSYFVHPKILKSLEGKEVCGHYISYNSTPSNRLMLLSLEASGVKLFSKQAAVSFSKNERDWRTFSVYLAAQALLLTLILIKYHRDKNVSN